MTTDRNSEGAVEPFGHIYRVVANGSEARPWSEREGIVFRLGPVTHEGARNGVVGSIEYLNLFTTPPASIPAAEVQALVEADLEYDNAMAAFHATEPGPETHTAGRRVMDAIARRHEALRELAKLIPRNPE